MARVKKHRNDIIGLAAQLRPTAKSFIKEALPSTALRKKL